MLKGATLKSESAIDVEEDFSNLTVVIPAYNEEKAIGNVIDDLRSNLPGIDILVVNDASSDRTGEIAGEQGVSVIQLPYNHGYGGALRLGMLAATGEEIAWFDSDSEHRAEDLLRMVRRLRNEKLAAVFGERSGSASRLRGIGKLAIRFAAMVLGLGYVRDFNCGLRVFKSDAILDFMLLLPRGFSASATSTFLTLRGHLPFAFERITVRERTGSSTVRWKDGPRTILSVLRIASILKPLRLFAVPGMVFLASGAVYGFAIAIILGRGIPVLSVLVAVTGILLMATGILADQISQLRIQHSLGWAISLRIGAGRPVAHSDD